MMAEDDGPHFHEGIEMTKATLVTIGIALLVIWALGFIVFKVAGFLIHVLLIVAVIALIAGVVRRVRGVT